MTWKISEKLKLYLQEGWEPFAVTTWGNDSLAEKEIQIRFRGVDDARHNRIQGAI